ncbi:MAG TPA: shikimate dehydrogenase [Gemmatimonadaceae bacterium]|nr:shikimate dehydrogenase [Gemmatimonadaceae bacterium]
MEMPGRLVLLGHPVAHSLSPVFQNAALVAAELPLRYEALDVAPSELSAMVGLLADARAAGNVTVPHKESVYAWCARRTPLAERVGAVNTFWTEDGGLVGDNTDVGGFDFAVRRLLDRDPGHLTVALLGAGGAAAAVCAAVEGWTKSRVLIHARTTERAAQLAARFPHVAETAVGEMEAIRDADLIVNATPLGLEGSLMPVSPGSIPERAAVLDLTYRRGRTPWVKACRARGLRADDGLPMLLEQGALAFTRWFGIEPDREAMWRAVRS